MSKSSRISDKREAEALAAQDQLDPRALALAVDPGEPAPAGREQALVLVEADRARRQREFLRELGNGIGGRRPLGSGRLGVAPGGIDGGHRSAAARERRIGQRSVTIAYRLDSLGGFPEDAASHKNLPSSARMSGPLPQSSIYPVDAPPAPGRGDRDRAGRALAADAAAVRARSHQSLAAPRSGRRSQRSSTAASATSRPATLWERHIATTLASMPIRRIIATHYHPDHVGNAAWLSARFGAPVAMTHAEYLTAHAAAGEFGGYSTGGDDRPLPPPRHGRDATVAALAKRGNNYRRGVPDLPQSFDRMLGGELRQAGDTTWRIVIGHGHSPEHASLYSAERGVLISGDMLLPRISTNVSVTAVDPDGDPLRRFLDSLAAFTELPADTLVLPSHGLPFRGIAVARRAAPRAPRGKARRARRRGARGRGAALRGRSRSRALPPRARHPAALLRHGRGDRPSQFSLASAKLERRVDADGSIRFAPCRRIICPRFHRPSRANTMSSTAKTRAVPAPGARPVPRSRGPRGIAAHRRRKEREGDRRLRRAPGEVRQVARRRRARDRQGVHGARREDARESVPARRVADEPVVELHEPLAGVDDQAPRAEPPIPSPRPARATSASSTRTGSSISCSTTSSRAT